MAPLWLLCPYDVDSLNQSVVREAERNHPYLEGMASIR
jgi:hypothetical protein